MIRKKLDHFRYISSADGCPPPSSIGTLVHPKQRYIIGHKLSEQDVQCESGYSTSTAVCQSDGKWSRDSICQKGITF